MATNVTTCDNFTRDLLKRSRDSCHVIPKSQWYNTCKMLYTATCYVHNSDFLTKPFKTIITEGGTVVSTCLNG
jgi:hypothetical protein